MPFTTYAPHLALALALAATAPGALAVVGSAQAQQPLEVPSDERQLNAWISKMNAYTGLLNGSLRASSSWSRYTSWVNVKSGPTGKERIIYGLYEVSPEIAKRATDASEKAVSAEPKIPQLDDLVRDYALTFQALIPVMNEASRYYERQDYKDDKMAKGQELHGKLVPAAEAFLARRAQLEAELKIVRTVVNQRQLEAIEKREGKSYAWHLRNVLNQAEPLGDLIVQEPTPALLKPLDESIASFAKSGREFDDYLATPGAQKGRGTFDGEPRSFLGQVREYREELGSKRPNMGTKLQFLVQKYNSMIQSANMESRFRT